MATLRRVEQRRSFIYPALASLGIAMLACCAQRSAPPRPKTAAVEPPPSPQAPAVRRRVFPLPAHKPTPPPENVGSTPSSAEATALAPPAAVASLAPPQATPPLPNGDALIGLDQPAARRLFGTAAERSDAPPATIWRYRSANCELDLFFYLDLKSGKMRTLHYAFKGEPGDVAGQQDCLRSLVVARKS